MNPQRKSAGTKTAARGSANELLGGVDTAYHAENCGESPGGGVWGKGDENPRRGSIDKIGGD